MTKAAPRFARQVTTTGDSIAKNLMGNMNKRKSKKEKTQQVVPTRTGNTPNQNESEEQMNGQGL